MKYILTLGALLICITAFGKNAHIRIDISDYKDIVAVSANMPVGGYVNSNQQTWYYPVNNTVDIELDIPSPVFIRLEGMGRKYHVIVAPNDDIQLKVYKKGDIRTAFSFKGSNAAGQYWYNEYNFSPLDNFHGINAIIGSVPYDNNNAIFDKMVDFLHKQLQPLDSLCRSKQIDSQFLTLAKADLRAMYVGFLLSQIRTLQEKKPGISLADKYDQLIDRFSNALGTNNILFTKTYFGEMFLESYWTARVNYTKGFFRHNAYDMGTYNGYQLADGPVKCFLTGNILFFEKAFGSNDFDYDKTFTVYKSEFPASPYINVLNKLQKNAQVVYANSPGQVIQIDTTSKFNTIADLRQHFKGKNIYIDLWATWCMPCRMEFPYYSRMKKTLADKKITPVFISIDQPQARSAWKNLVKQSQLNGYNIIANDNLRKDIKKVIYKDGQFSVPRYILINNKDMVLSWDAPRPSEPALKGLLDKLTAD